MSSMQGKQALIIGASSGIGRATVEAVLAQGARVTAVARGRDALEKLRAETGGQVRIVQADATDPESAERLLRESKAEVVVLAAGIQPPMGSIDEHTWDTFSAAWNADTKAAFHLVKAAFAVPLASGSKVLMLSSGAAIGGSPLSGGYAGAKRMQWLLADYAQELADKKGLGIRFLAVLPAQLIVGTAIGNAAAEACGATRGISAAELFERNWKSPLDAGKVAAAIVKGICGETAPDVTAIAVIGEGIEPLA